MKGKNNIAAGWLYLGAGRHILHALSLLRCRRNLTFTCRDYDALSQMARWQIKVVHRVCQRINPQHSNRCPCDRGRKFPQSTLKSRKNAQADCQTDWLRDQRMNMTLPETRPSPAALHENGSGYEDIEPSARRAPATPASGERQASSGTSPQYARPRSAKRICACRYRW